MLLTKRMTALSCCSWRQGPFTSSPQATSPDCCAARTIASKVLLAMVLCRTQKESARPVNFVRGLNFQAITGALGFLYTSFYADARNMHGRAQQGNGNGHPFLWRLHVSCLLYSQSPQAPA